MLSPETETYLFYVAFMGMMVFMFVMKSLVEKYKPSFGHETGATIVLGVIFSLIFYFSSPNDDRTVNAF